MRVFHLVKGLGRGGAETLLVRTAGSRLGAQRRNGYGYFLPWKDALVSELESQGCLVRCFAARNPVEMFLKLPEIVSFLKSWKPDIIHCHLPLAGVIGRLAGKILDVPVVYTEHNLQERYHFLTRVANRLTWSFQSKVVAVSNEVEESIARSIPGDTPVQTVLNGVDCRVFSPHPELRARTRKELSLKEDDFLVGTVAVFRKQKRLDLWLEVARRLAQEHGNVHFLLVGDGPESPTVGRLVQQYELAERVRFPGLCSDVLPYLCAMDTFLMSSEFEGLPVALLEAMACETPIVATTAGGIGEVVRSETEGLLAEKGDVSSLTSYLSALIENRALARRVGKSGRERVLDSFSLARMNGELEGIYAQVLGAPTEAGGVVCPEGYAAERELADEDALSLVKTALGSGSERSPRTLDFYRWKHSENPFGRSWSLGLRSSERNELAGLRLFQRWGLKRDCETFSAVRAVDTATHPHHQRRGIFTYLTRLALQEMKEEGVDLVFNTPNKNSLPGYLKMGWELAGRSPVLARPLPPGRGGRQRARAFSDLFSSYGERAVESLLVDCRVPGRLQIEKSADYLKWRYGGHPGLDYSFAVSGTAEELRALVIWCETSRFRLRELALCELFARSWEEGQRLLEEILGATSCTYAVCSFWNYPTAEHIVSRAGFRRVPFKSIGFTVMPLSEQARQAVHGANWALGTGDLQVF